MRRILRNIFLNLAGRIKRPHPGVHIINSHYITPYKVDYERDVAIFESYLSFLSKTGRFITLEEATQRILNKDIPKDKVLLTFTFDDGFEECYTIIAPLLEKFNTRGTFFINANYIDSSEEYQKEFNKRVAIHTKKPMTWKQIKELHKRGHLIGSHNFDHTNFAILSDKDIDYQLHANKTKLEEELNYKCNYFAWTYGQLQHFPPRALDITLRYHPFIFSGTNYRAYFSYDGQVVNRRHQEAFWPKAYNRYFLAVKKR